MAVLRELVAARSEEDRWRPLKVIEVKPEAFATTWDKRPQITVEVGLRLVADEDLQTARAEAVKFALEMHSRDDDDELNACFNDALLRWRIAKTCCSPEDSRRPFFDYAEDTVREALTTEGVKALAHEIELFETETSPLYQPATDDELLDLATILQDGPPWAKMGEADQRGVRRLLAAALERFGDAMSRAET